MSAWETEDEYLSGTAAADSLPVTMDAPYRSSSPASRRSRKSASPNGKRISPPPVMSADHRSDRASRRSSRDVSVDENISILDPRRFTPTLHANLVSEILTLKRDQEDKTKLIESLEQSLKTSRDEQQTIQQTLTSTSKESRSLQRQLSLLEGGTSSALGELARERDEAVESAAETKKRLDAAQKRLRTQEDDSQRVHILLAQDKSSWEDERRKYERKIHIAESRLKTVLDEVAAYQAAHAKGSQHHDQGELGESDVEERGRDNDAASVRTMSMTNSVRFSIINPRASGLQNGNSLADELNFHGGDDDDTDMDGRDSVFSSPEHRRTFSRDSDGDVLRRSRRSVESPKRSGSMASGSVFANQTVLDALEGQAAADEDVAPGASYTDSGIQYSPPPSPTMVEAGVQPEADIGRPVAPEGPRLVKTTEADASSNRDDPEIEANQRRKRVQVSRSLALDPSQIAHKQHMISAAVQTAEAPLSPPRTPKTPCRIMTPPPEQKPAMISSSMQTEDGAEDQPEERPLNPAVLSSPTVAPPPIPIPTISVQPPASRPTTPRSPKLPQHFKHFGCQVNLSTTVATSDVSVQTEGIQIDRRLQLLPAHLQPSSITSRPNSPNPSDANKNFTPVPGDIPPRNPRRLTQGSTDRPVSSDGNGNLHDAYPGNNDDGPLSNRASSPRRPHRFSSLFAGFDTASSDEADEFGDAEMSDSEYRTALSAPRPPSTSTTGQTGKRSSAAAINERTYRRDGRGSAKQSGHELYSTFSLNDKESQSGKQRRKPIRPYETQPPPAAPSTGSRRNSAMRKAAIIQSGIATQQGRSRSPSLLDVRNPPFPIPRRASSIKSPFGLRNTPSDGRRSPTRSSDVWHRRGNSRSYQPTTSSLRKSRSAAALQRTQRYRRHGSRSPPPLSPSTEAPESPGLPPLPRNDITTPRNNRERGGSHYKKHKHGLSTNTDNTMNTEPASQTSSTQNTGVVDAIAQTMVGEWMFKYVRRRKSFSVADAGGKEENSNDRHKRWVWLAPYERAILWSSKQPSSGSALMGKSGRKLTIQSVLDVKDDNPAPKGAQSVFNRSILILTPQRALKFTAVSADRHYLWLTALSFLAHSSQTVPESISAPLPRVQEQPPPEFELPKPKPRRGGIRDSIRLAKGKSGNGRAGPPTVPSVPSVPSSQMGDVVSFRVDSSGAPSSSHTREQSGDAAEPPMIHRFNDRNMHTATAAHNRKRSNTGGHVPPPLSYRGFSGPAGSVGQHNSTNSTANASVDTAGSSDLLQSPQSSNTTWAMSQGESQHNSETSSQQGNFFDAIGTVRMEAFISPLALSQAGGSGGKDDLQREFRRRSKEKRRRNSRSRRDSYYRSVREYDDYSYSGCKTAGEEEQLRDDPFKGF